MTYLDKRDLLQCLEEDLHYYKSVTSPDDTASLSFLERLVKQVEEFRNG